MSSWTCCPTTTSLPAKPKSSSRTHPKPGIFFELPYVLYKTFGVTDIQQNRHPAKRHPAAEWKSSRRIWHCHLHLVPLSRGHENFHDDMNMSAIITWSMEFIATTIFFTYDQRHFIAMIQNILPWTTVFHSYDHHFHTWSGVIHSYEYWFIAWRVMNSDHEQLLFMRFIYEN